MSQEAGPSNPPETQYQPLEDSLEEELEQWSVVQILGEDNLKGRYLVEWEDIDPDTEYQYRPTWEPKVGCTQDLIDEWKKNIRKDPSKRGLAYAKGRLKQWDVDFAKYMAEKTKEKLAKKQESKTKGKGREVSNESREKGRRGRPRRSVEVVDYDEDEDEDAEVPRRKRRRDQDDDGDGGKKKRRSSGDPRQASVASGTSSKKSAADHAAPVASRTRFRSASIVSSTHSATEPPPPRTRHRKRLTPTQSARTGKEYDPIVIDSPSIQAPRKASAHTTNKPAISPASGSKQVASTIKNASPAREEKGWRIAENKESRAIAKDTSVGGKKGSSEQVGVKLASVAPRPKTSLQLVPQPDKQIFRSINGLKDSERSQNSTNTQESIRQFSSPAASGNQRLSLGKKNKKGTPSKGNSRPEKEVTDKDGLAKTKKVLINGEEVEVLDEDTEDEDYSAQAGVHYPVKRSDTGTIGREKKAGPKKARTKKIVISGEEVEVLDEDTEDEDYSNQGGINDPVKSSDTGIAGKKVDQKLAKAKKIMINGEEAEALDEDTEDGDGTGSTSENEVSRTVGEVANTSKVSNQSKGIEDNLSDEDLDILETTNGPIIASPTAETVAEKQKEIDGLQSDLKIANTQLEQLRSKTSAMEQVKSDLNTFQARVTQLESERLATENLQAELKSARDQVGKLDSRQKEREKEMENLKASHAQLEELKSKVDKINQVQDELQAAQAEVETLRSDLEITARLKNDLKAAQLQAEQWEKKQIELDQLRVKLKAVSEDKEKLESLQDQAKDLQPHAEAVLKAMGESKSKAVEMEKLRSRNDLLVKEKVDLKAKLDTLHSTNSSKIELERENKELKEEVIKLNNEIQVTRTTSEGDQISAGVADSRIEELESKVVSQQQQYDFLKAQYDIASNRAVEEVQENDRLREQLKIKRKQLDQGLKQKDLHYKAILKKDEDEFKQIKVQNQLLIRQSQLTDDVVRSKAVMYPKVKKDNEKLMFDNNRLMDRVESLKKRNEDLMDQLELLRAKSMGVLDDDQEEKEGEGSGSGSESETDTDSNDPTSDFDEHQARMGHLGYAAPIAGISSSAISDVFTNNIPTPREMNDSSPASIRTNGNGNFNLLNGGSHVEIHSTKSEVKEEVIEVGEGLAIECQFRDQDSGKLCGQLYGSREALIIHFQEHKNELRPTAV